MKKTVTNETPTTDLRDAPGTARFTLKHEDPTIMRFYYSQRGVFWQPDELKFGDDKADYSTVKPRHREIYKSFLEFFVSGDGVVTEQALYFAQTAITPEERAFLLAQILNEQDHLITYTRAIKEVIPVEEQDDVFSAVENVPCVKAKADFIFKWCESDQPRSIKYLAAAFAEGTFFTSLFALVFYFNSKNLFKNFGTANQFIMRDETLHRDFNVFMSKKISRDTKVAIDQDIAHQIAREAVEIEIDHINHILYAPIDSVEADSACGLTRESLTDYAKNLVDQVLVLAGFEALYNVRANLPWMAGIGLQSKKNFYETLVTEYSGGSVEAAMKTMMGNATGATVASTDEPSDEDIDF